MVIRAIGGYQDGTPQLLYGKRTDLYHSEMSCATFGLGKVPLSKKTRIRYGLSTWDI